MNIKELLYRTESDSLDFKEEQYKFVNEDNKHIKSELLKDILAFANAWRDSDAYILIGIKENNKSEHEIIGISETIDDASLQEFVNSKTNKAIKFEYGTITIEEKLIAYIKIPIQKRPFYIKKDYGKVKSNTVYLRRGSATVIANPDEISDMGEAIVKNNHIILNPTNYEISAELRPLNLDSEKKIIENNIRKAEKEISILKEDNFTSNKFESRIFIAINKKPKDKHQYKQEINSYKLKLEKYIKLYNEKLNNLKNYSNIYYLELSIENIGNTFDTNINININFSKGKIVKKTDLLAYFLKELHVISYPKKPLKYTEINLNLNSIQINSPDFSLNRDILKIPHPNPFYRDITINDSNVSVIIKEMNVGDNILVLKEKLFFISEINNLQIKAVIKSNKSTSKIMKIVDYKLLDKSIDIDNFKKDSE